MDSDNNLIKKNNERSFFSALALAWELGYRIALPLTVFAVGGRLLDKKLETDFIFLLLGIILSLTVSGLMVFWKIKEILKDFEVDQKKDK